MLSHDITENKERDRKLSHQLQSVKYSNRTLSEKHIDVARRRGLCLQAEGFEGLLRWEEDSQLFVGQVGNNVVPWGAIQPKEKEGCKTIGNGAAVTATDMEKTVFIAPALPYCNAAVLWNCKRCKYTIKYIKAHFAV